MKLQSKCYLLHKNVNSDPDFKKIYFQKNKMLNIFSNVTQFLIFKSWKKIELKMEFTDHLNQIQMCNGSKTEYLWKK